jgi:hypothetical protein
MAVVGSFDVLAMHASVLRRHPTDLVRAGAAFDPTHSPDRLLWLDARANGLLFRGPGREPLVDYTRQDVELWICFVRVVARLVVCASCYLSPHAWGRSVLIDITSTV